jgi:hypothetical protein
MFDHPGTDVRLLGGSFSGLDSIGLTAGQANNYDDPNQRRLSQHKPSSKHAVRPFKPAILRLAGIKLNLESPPQLLTVFTIGSKLW